MTAKRGNHHPVFKAIAKSPRREVLCLLLVRDAPVTEQELAVHLQATKQRLTKTSQATQQDIHAELVHIHLPTLENAGLITWNQDEATIDTPAHPAFDDPRFGLLLEAEADDLDEVFSHLANDRRRILLTILRNEPKPISLTTLARELLERETQQTDLDPGTVEDVIVLMYHTHLPELANADLIEYHPDAGHAKYLSHPALEEVFTIIYEPDKRLADAYAGFFEGLQDTYKQITEAIDEEADWPTSWRDPAHD